MTTNAVNTGLAWVGSSCHSNRYYRSMAVGIGENYVDDALWAVYVFAHETGHNIGMEHIFVEDSVYHPSINCSQGGLHVQH